MTSGDADFDRLLDDVYSTYGEQPDVFAPKRSARRADPPPHKQTKGELNMAGPKGINYGKGKDPLADGYNANIPREATRAQSAAVRQGLRQQGLSDDDIATASGLLMKYASDDSLRAVDKRGLTSSPSLVKRLIQIHDDMQNKIVDGPPRTPGIPRMADYKESQRPHGEVLEHHYRQEVREKISRAVFQDGLEQAERAPIDLLKDRVPVVDPPKDSEL